jgi:hypothetical protein
VSIETLIEEVGNESLRAAMKAALAERKRECVLHGWENAVGYISDGPCQYESGVPESTGATVLKDFVRAAKQGPQPMPEE